MKKENRYAEWLGFQSPPDIENAETLGRVLGWILTGLIIISALFFLGFLVRMGMAILSSADPNPPDEAIRNIGLALAAVVGLPFLVWRSIVAQQQVRVAEQGQITDRINKAVEGLGAVRVTKSHTIRGIEKAKPLSPAEVAALSRAPLASARTRQSLHQTVGTEIEEKTDLTEQTEPNIEVRLGALYSLERIAQDSPRDHISIMEIICAYIRENTRYSEFIPSSEMPESKPRTDVQAAVNVLAHRQDWQRAIEIKKKFRLDLSFSDLTGIDFKKGDFTGAIFDRSNLERAEFLGCNLSGSRFGSALLNYSNFVAANLTGADWKFAIFNKGNSASLTQTKIRGLNLKGADIQILDILTVTFPINAVTSKEKKTIGNTETKLGFGFNLTEAYLQAIEHSKITTSLTLSDTTAEKQSEICQTLSENPFEFWSDSNLPAFDTTMATHKYRQKLGLTGWPYDDD